MKWWKRLIFSIISLIWGFVSLDYLYLAFSLLTNLNQNNTYYNLEGKGVMQIVGAVMFLVWFLLLAGYTILIKNAAIKIDLIEENAKTGEKRVKMKWFDIILQYALIITGAGLRWVYLFCIIF